MIADPTSALPRPDLVFLRRRSKPRPSAVAAPLADFITGHAHRPRQHEAAPPAPAAPPASAPPASAPPPAAAPPAARPAAATPPASSAPASGALDLSRPAAPAPTPAPPPPAAPAIRTGAGALDLSGSSALDLSGGPAAPPPVPQPPSRPKARVRRDTRLRAGDQHLLSVKAPTVTLTRVQSGIGQLEIEAVCSAAVGDLRLGAAYQLGGGVTSTVQYTGGNRYAPSSRRPVVVAGRDEYEHLRIDLRKSRELERLAVYAFSESRTELRWGGTLVLTTFGGGRIELPLESLHPGKVAVLMSLYNLDGELVVRAEMETIDGDVREAARAYGYDRITWRDDRAPVDA